MRIVAMRIEYVHIVQIHPFEALVEAADQVLTRAVVSVWARPHVVSGLCRYEKFIPVWTQVALHYAAECGFCAPV